jgi:hypothetical protein
MALTILPHWGMFYILSRGYTKEIEHGPNKATAGQKNRVGPRETDGFMDFVASQLPWLVDSSALIFSIWTSIWTAIWTWFIISNSCPGGLFPSHSSLQTPRNFLSFKLFYVCLNSGLAELMVGAKGWPNIRMRNFELSRLLSILYVL